jgi:DnaJ-class molecular chaperone
MSAAVVAVRECPYCHGDGEVQVGDMSASPFSGVPVLDPELDAYARCWHCQGTGELVDRRSAGLASEQRSQRPDLEGSA